MKQIFRDILFLMLLPITFVALLLEAKLQITPFQHKLMQIFIMFIIYILVAIWINIDIKIKERKMNRNVFDELKVKRIKLQKKEAHQEINPLKTQESKNN